MALTMMMMMMGTVSLRGGENEGELPARWWRSLRGGGGGSWAATTATAMAVLIIILFHSLSHLRNYLRRTRARVSSSSPSLCSDLGSEIVTDDDLGFLIRNLDAVSGHDNWENVICKSNPLVSYTALSSQPKDAPLKYLSVTVFQDCSPELLRDFYMDNQHRIQWDRTVIEHVQLHLDAKHGIEIGQTIKKFPLLMPREYVLAWRLWEGSDGAFYCFTKECEHPLAPRQGKYVRVKYFRSGWRIKKVPSTSASEITMFHQEDAGLNVELAKMAFAKGIWRYVCKMDSALRKYASIHSPHNSAVSAVTFIQKVPPALDNSGSSNSSSMSPTSQLLAESIVAKKRLLRRPSKKALANGFLLLGGIICLTRGHSTLGAKVAVAYVLTKLSKRGASSGQNLRN